MGDRFHVIESGTAEVIGDACLVGTLRPWEVFGDIALLQGPIPPRTPAACAVAPSTAPSLAHAAGARLGALYEVMAFDGTAPWRGARTAMG